MLRDEVKKKKRKQTSIPFGSLFEHASDNHSDIDQHNKGNDTDTYGNYLRQVMLLQQVFGHDMLHRIGKY